MAQVFPRYMNTVARVTAVSVVTLAVASLWLWDRLQRSPYVTDVRIAKTQPVPFSHRHHVGEIGIDCRYCHQTVETSAFAGIPPTELCIGCHNQIWSDSPMLAPVHASFKNDQPLRWSRIHDLPDYAYFNHSAHLTAGVGCSSASPVQTMRWMSSWLMGSTRWALSSLKASWLMGCTQLRRHRQRSNRAAARLAHSPRLLCASVQSLTASCMAALTTAAV